MKFEPFNVLYSLSLHWVAYLQSSHPGPSQALQRGLETCQSEDQMGTDWVFEQQKASRTPSVSHEPCRR